MSPKFYLISVELSYFVVHISFIYLFWQNIHHLFIILIIVYDNQSIFPSHILNKFIKRVSLIFLYNYILTTFIYTCIKTFIYFNNKKAWNHIESVFHESTLLNKRPFVFLPNSSSTYIQPRLNELSSYQMGVCGINSSTCLWNYLGVNYESMTMTLY